MPNHTTNIWVIKDAGEHSAAGIFGEILNEKGEVDFEKVIPPPACLEDFEPHEGIILRAMCAAGLLKKPNKGTAFERIMSSLELNNAASCVVQKASDNDLLMVTRALQNYRECGHFYWHSWKIEKRGTKWNAYGHRAGKNSLTFQTANGSGNIPLKALSEKFPDVTFFARYANEDLGSRCGQFFIKNGERFNEEIAPDSRSGDVGESTKWRNFAFKICYPGANPADHGLDDDCNYSVEE